MTATSKLVGPEVRVGQVWADNDTRVLEERQILVLEIQNGKVKCRNTKTARVSWVSVERFRPTSTGYHLVSQPADKVE